jgi:uncharacterized protein YxjI
VNSDTSPPGWYADPSGRFEHRWFDGTQWTNNVSTNGQQSTDDPASTGHVSLAGGLDNMTPERIRQQAAVHGGTGTGTGGGTIMTEPLLVVNQKAKLIEVSNQYAIFDRDGKQLGSVNEVGQSTAKKVLRVLTSVDQFMTHRLEVRDISGAVVMTLTRPAKLVKSKVIVSDPSGQEIGTISQANAIGKIRFDFLVNGQAIGQIRAENWRAWNFGIFDASENEVGRITKTFEGLAKTMFTTADNYVVSVSPQISGALRAMVVASSLCVDTALKQDSRGLG